MMKILILTIFFTLSQSFQFRPPLTTVVNTNNGGIITHKNNVVTANNLWKHRFSHFRKHHITNNNLGGAVLSQDFVKTNPINYRGGKTAGFTNIRTDSSSGKKTIIKKTNIIKPNHEVVTAKKIQNFVESDMNDKLCDTKDHTEDYKKKLNHFDFDVHDFKLGKIIQESNYDAINKLVKDNTLQKNNIKHYSKIYKKKLKHIDFDPSDFKLGKIIKDSNYDTINKVLKDNNLLLLKEKLITEDKIRNQLPAIKSSLVDFHKNAISNGLNEALVINKLKSVKPEKIISHIKANVPENLYKKIMVVNDSPFLKENIHIIKNDVKGYASGWKSIEFSKDKQLELYKKLQDLRDNEKAKLQLQYGKLQAEKLLSKYNIPVKKGILDVDEYLNKNYPFEKKAIVKYMKPIQTYISQNKNIDSCEILKQLKVIKKNSKLNLSKTKKYYYDQISKNKALKEYDQILKKEYEYMSDNLQLKERLPKIKNNYREFITGSKTFTISETDKIKLKAELEKLKKMKLKKHEFMEKLQSNKKLSDAYILLNGKGHEFINNDYFFHETVPRIKNKVPEFVETFKSQNIFGDFKTPILPFDKKYLTDGIFAERFTKNYKNLILNDEHKELLPNIQKIETVDLLPIPEITGIKPVMKIPQTELDAIKTDLLPAFHKEYPLLMSDFHDNIIDFDVSKKMKNKKPCKNNLLKEKNLFSMKNEFHQNYLPVDSFNPAPLLDELQMPIETASFKLNDFKPTKKCEKNKQISKLHKLNVLNDDLFPDLLHNGEQFVEDEFKYGVVPEDHTYNDNIHKINSMKSFFNQSPKCSKHTIAQELGYDNGRHFLKQIKFDSEKLQMANAFDVLKQKSSGVVNKFDSNKLLLPYEYSYLKQNMHKLKDNIKDAYILASPRQKLHKLKVDLKDTNVYHSAKQKMDLLKHNFKDVYGYGSPKQKLLKLKGDLKESYDYSSAKQKLDKMKYNIKDAYLHYSPKQKLLDLKDAYSYNSAKKKLNKLKNNIKHSVYFHSSPEVKLSKLKNEVKNSIGYSSAKENLKKLKLNMEDVHRRSSSKLKLDEIKQNIKEAHYYDSTKFNLEKLKDRVKNSHDSSFLKQDMSQLKNSISDTIDASSSKLGLEKLKDSIQDVYDQNSTGRAKKEQEKQHSQEVIEDGNNSKMISSAGNESALENDEKAGGGKKYKQYVITTRRKKNGKSKNAEQIPQDLKKIVKEEEPSK